MMLIAYFCHPETNHMLNIIFTYKIVDWLAASVSPRVGGLVGVQLAKFFYPMGSKREWQKKSAVR
jgi:hypothetical protein